MEPTTMDTTVFGYHVSSVDRVTVEQVEEALEFKCITH